MTKRYAHVKNDEVLNVSIWEDEISPVDNDPDVTFLEVTSSFTVGVGWTLVDGVWTPPPGSFV